MDVGWPAAAASRWGNLCLLFPSFQARLPRTGVMSREWRVGGWKGGGGWGGGGGREQCSPEQPVSLLWQVIKFEMPTQCTPGAGVEKMSRNSQTLCSQVSWHRCDKYRPRWTLAGPETMIRVTLGLRLIFVYFLLLYLFGCLHQERSDLFTVNFHKLNRGGDSGIQKRIEEYWCLYCNYAKISINCFSKDFMSGWKKPLKQLLHKLCCFGVKTFITEWSTLTKNITYVDISRNFQDQYHNCDKNTRTKKSHKKSSN